MNDSAPGGMGSVDNALKILVLLGEYKSLRVMEVADHLSVARSTAHRLLTALLQREFVVKDADKVYHPGPAFISAGFRSDGIPALREAMRPHLQKLAGRVGETCHLVVLEGNGARFIDGIGSTQILRVGSRIGMLLPAHTSAAGKALLAELSQNDLFALYPFGLPGARPGAPTEPAKRIALRRELTITRRRGYATNINETEHGVTAVAVALKDKSGRAVASVAVAAPNARCPRSRVDTLAEILRDAATAAEGDIEHAEVAANSATQNLVSGTL